jgi:CxxC motif-containing protein (DUF1111 family)
MKKPLSKLTFAGTLGLGLLQAMCGSSETPEPGTGDAGSGNNDVSDASVGGSGTAGGAASPEGGAAGLPAVGGSNTGGTMSNLPPGECPSGFVTCHDVCLEASLIGADCKPLTCDAPASVTPPARANGVSARGFDWDVAFDGEKTVVTYKPGAAGNSLSATIGVDVQYRVNGEPALHVAPMVKGGDGAFTLETPDVKAGDDLEFYFRNTVARQTIVADGPQTEPLIDTMWFHQKVGEARTPEPSYPLTVKLAGRFRDRHPNEERYDHYVDTYFAGPTFDLTFVDYGDSLDVTIVPQATMDVQAVDFKYYECFGSGMSGATPAPVPLCGTPPALAAIGVRAENQGNSVFTAHVDRLSYGQLIDFELTFVRSRTYYTEWFQYYVGSGRLQPKVQHPWAHAAGDQSVDNVTLDEFGYAQHVPNITPQQLADFISGKVLFEADFESKVGYNPPTTYDCPRGVAPGTDVPTILTPPPPSPLFNAGNSYSNPELSNAVRPGFTAGACFSCHHLDGKGRPADGQNMGDTLLKLFAENGAPDLAYGTILDRLAPGGATAESTPSVTWETIDGTFEDGTPYELRKPVLATGALRDGELGASTHISMRVPRPVFGLGFLEAVAPETILARSDPDDVNHDGISGRANFVKDPVTGAEVLGRFGWKAGTASLREQAALAFVNDIGVTSTVYPKHSCGSSQSQCLEIAATESEPALSEQDLDHIESYLRGLSVPPRRNYEDPKAIAGKAVFESLGCINCHVPNLVTSTRFAVAELRGIVIQPFTDLLLHDMGDDLADSAPLEEGSATGREWRTPPLWGNGTGTAVLYPAIDAFDPNANPPPGGVYLHDGRARSITEAILWHGGEAEPMREAFKHLNADLREKLLAYVAYPFADPIPLRRCEPGMGKPVTAE